MFLSWSKKIFSGFKSRWNTPLEWQNLTPWQICWKYSLATSSSNFPLSFTKSYNSPPLKNSRTKYTSCCPLSTSNRFTTHGWNTSAIVFISCNSISLSSTLCSICRFKILIAYGSFDFDVVANFTLPYAPSPSVRVTAYCPIFCFFIFIACCCCCCCCCCCYSFFFVFFFFFFFFYEGGKIKGAFISFSNQNRKKGERERERDKIPLLVAIGEKNGGKMSPRSIKN